VVLFFAISSLCFLILTLLIFLLLLSLLSFVIRLAGNTVDALARASLLYAVLHLQSPLVVVLGHEKCGAVTAALQPDEALVDAPGDIKTLVKDSKSK